jgi:DNA-repair protein XRCC1
MKKVNVEVKPDDMKVGQTFSKWKETKQLVDPAIDEQPKKRIVESNEIKQESTRISSQLAAKRPDGPKKKRKRDSSMSNDEMDHKRPAKKQSNDKKAERKTKQVEHRETFKQEQKSPNKPNERDIMANVVFSLSGFQNPERAILRDKAVQMGAKYKTDWDNACTHLM